MNKGDVVNDNAARSFEATAVAYVERRHIQEPEKYPGSPIDNRKLMNKLAGLGDSRVRLHKELTQPVLDQNETDLDWVSERLDMEIRDEPYMGSDALEGSGTAERYRSAVFAGCLENSC